MNRIIVVFALLALAGCSSTSAKTHAKRGVSGIEIDCSGLGNKWEKCEKRAARECKMQGYKVITRSSDAEDEEGDYLFGWNPAGAVTRTMLVICK
ncbi:MULTISPECIES: lipoprotein [Pseudomonas]|jgi:hypothetical protein|uniref:Lipoprotein n=3 Tax=Pseudomonas TaxID=286 RepID=A0A109KZR0_PSEFL|nr:MULTISPECIES: lipoprotein [Pseudomonas]KRP95556.1 lipoprotein [Pseudomonas lactis]KWV78365.1 hypothetical protein PFLL34_04897 [Pseudomonas fluorescens]KWV86847.1 hypothetical protein PFLmoz3_03584 [Pseudomonas fluorescens]MBA1254149.1 hypothetical protein [Pseudomonas carnis]MBA1268883.1 hypothetical protein [Pseudomonas carnis]|tara:strand:+ start:37 stop:321 length:285 start_codon:yes stop_codon:yes gene_type:complete